MRRSLLLAAALLTLVSGCAETETPEEAEQRRSEHQAEIDAAYWEGFDRASELFYDYSEIADYIFDQGGCFGLFGRETCLGGVDYPEWIVYEFYEEWADLIASDGCDAYFDRGC